MNRETKVVGTLYWCPDCESKKFVSYCMVHNHKLRPFTKFTDVNKKEGDGKW